MTNRWRLMRPQSRQWTSAVGAGLLAFAATAPTAAAADDGLVQPSRRAPVACLTSPAADHLSFGPHLAATVRSHDGVIEISHRVACGDGTVRWVWMADSDLGASG